MPDGSRYHALDPDVFYWAHATFWYGNVRLCERFGPWLSEDQKRQLFEESKNWYAMYGVSMRPVPETYEDFLEYWDNMCRNVLRDHESVRTVLDISTLPAPPALSFVPDRLLAHGDCACGGTQLHLAHHRLLRRGDPRDDGTPWSDRDEKLFRILGKGYNLVFHRLMPKRISGVPR